MALVFDFTERKWYQNAGNADTSGGAVAAVETEVNQIKAALRDAGVMAP